jgi:putative ABC transport system permease protein
MNRGHPYLRAFIRDSIKSAIAQPVTSVTAAAVVALVCAVVLVTAGRTAATERRVIESLSDAGSRVITVIDSTGEGGIHSNTVAATRNLPGVVWAVGFGAASDVIVDAPGTITGSMSTQVPVRQFIGVLPSGSATLIAGRLPQRPGEAVAGTNAANELGFLDGAGPAATSTQKFPIVGTVGLTDALSRFDDSVLVMAAAEASAPLRFVVVVAEEATTVTELSRAIEAVIHADRIQDVSIETPDAILALQTVISGQLGSSSRNLTAGVLLTGVVLIAIIMFAMISTRRRDFGRRRALGASRSAIVAIVTIQACTASFVGALVGTLTTTAVLAFTSDGFRDSPAYSYVAGLGVLTILSAAVGSFPPAILAARRDPVRVLRVP